MKHNVFILPLIACLQGLLFVASAIAADSNELVLPEVFRESFTDDLPVMRQRRVIRALVTNSRTDFFFHKGDAKGIQVEFLREYEKFINKGIKKAQEKIHIAYIPVQFNELIPALLAGKGDIAAAMLTITPAREQKVAFATGRAMRVNELVVTHHSVAPLNTLDDLAGKSIYVLSNSSYQEHLEELNRDFVERGLAPINIREADGNLKSEDILELVNSGVVKITVVDDYLANLWSEVLPDIRVHETLAITRDNTIGWAIRKENKELAKSLGSFVKKVKQGSLLGNIFIQRYFKDSKWVRNPTSRKEQQRLAAYFKLFRKYGEQYNFDYLAIMAQAYQESGLDHKRKSHRGAVGVMQLLPSTAADPNVGIKDISSVENNIHAGVKYLAFLRDRYFSDPGISRENQIAFSWAAYNAGPAKVRKMRNMAKKMGLDENVWFSNVELAAGKITGRETVKYVANIIKYYIAYKLSSGELDSY